MFAARRLYVVGCGGHARKLVFYWLPALAWMSVIFAFSSLPRATLQATQLEMPGHQVYWELLGPIAHIVEFAVLAALLYRLLASYPGLSGRYVLGGAFALTVLYGLTDELHQYFVPGRNISGVDLGLDTLGALLGLLLVDGIVRIYAMSRTPRPDKERAAV